MSLEMVSYFRVFSIAFSRDGLSRLVELEVGPFWRDDMRRRVVKNI